MRNFAFILALVLALTGCDESEATEALSPEAQYCRDAGYREGGPGYETCLQGYLDNRASATDPFDGMSPDAWLCAGDGIYEDDPRYEGCLQAFRSYSYVRGVMAKDYGVTLIDCVRPNGGKVWATREECSEMMGISIDH